MPADEGKLGSGSSVSGSDISNIVQLFTGKSTAGTTSGTQSTQNNGAVTNTGTTTTGTSISSDAMAAMLKSVLESNQGLASTALGEHSAGLYNSSTNQLLSNDLITRAASQVAQQAKTQVTTQNTAQSDTRGSTTSNTGATTSKTAAPVNPATAAKGATAIAGLSALSKFMPAGSGTSIVNKIKNGLGLGDSSNTAMIDGAKLGAANANTEAADLQSVYPASAPVVGTGSGVVGPVSDAGDMDFGGGSADTSSMSDFGSATGGFDIAGGGDYGSVDAGSADGYDPGFGDAAGNAAANFADFGSSDIVDAGSSGLTDMFSMFAADGGMIRDPNRPDAGPVQSNLSFAQQNPIAMRMASAIRPRASVAGYADGGQVSDVQPKSESIFARRTAALDAAEGAAVQGNDTNQAYQDRMKQSNSGSKDSSSGSSSGFIPTIRKVLHLANGGAVGFFDDGGHVDLTNLGLRVQPVQAASGSGLAALSAPSDANSSTSGGEVTGPQDHGTGFANTSNQTLTTATPQTAKKSTNPSNGNTRVEPAGESNSSAPGTAQGGIDANTATATQNAAVSLGLALTPLAPLAPLLNLALAALNAPNAPSATSDAAGATSSAAAAAAAAGVGDAVGSVSVGGMTGDASSEGGIDGTGPGTSGIGMSDSDAAGAASGADSAGVGATGASDGSDSASNGDAGTSGSSGGGTSGDSGVGGDSASAGDSAGGDGGASFATGGNVTGPGTDDSDSIPTKLSNGEFVVNAAAAAQFRPFLEMINNAVRARK